MANDPHGHSNQRFGPTDQMTFADCGRHIFRFVTATATDPGNGILLDFLKRT
jgi:hypothetical protein